MNRTICVFCSSSDTVAPIFFETAFELGRAIAEFGDRLVYGAGAKGLMGAVAKSVHEHGGYVIGIIPDFMNQRQGVTFAAADELRVTEDIRQRKLAMEQAADAFVCLPGGFGTLEESLEVLALKQLEQHSKPIVFLNVDGCFDHLLRQFDYIMDHHFAKPDHRKLYFVASDVTQAYEHINNYQPTPVTSKWF